MTGSDRAVHRLAGLARRAATAAGAPELAAARRHLIDALACAACGAESTLGAAIARALPPEGPGAEAGLLGCWMHLDEFDALHDRSATCPALSAVPVIGLGAGHSLDEVLRAVVAGYEVTVAAAAAADAPSYYGRGVWPSGLFAKLGAAATAGVLLGLDDDRTAHALAVAASSGWTVLGEITDAHATTAGTATRLGTEAALLAGEGVRGPLGVLDTGALALDPDAIGPAAAVLHTALKAYPFARPLHAVADGVRSLTGASGHESVERVSVVVPGQVLAILTEEPTPAGAGARRCSVPFVVRTVLAGRGSDPRAFGDGGGSTLPRVPVRLLPREDAVDALYPNSWPARVVVTAGGRDRSLLVPAPAGADGPPTDAQLAAKWGRPAWLAALATAPDDAVFGPAMMPGPLLREACRAGR